MTRSPRMEPRIPTYGMGAVVFKDKQCIMDCMVRDKSQSGMKVEFPHPITVIDGKVTFRFKGTNGAFTTQECEVVWKKARFAGLKNLTDEGV